MQPLNKAERSKAFLNFILLFLLCIAIIVTTVFFSVQVPFRQNDQLRTEMGTVTTDRQFANNFSAELAVITAMLDSINTKSLKPELLDANISERLKKLNVMADNDAVTNKPMYQNIVLNLADLQSAKKQLRDFTGKDANMDDLRKQLDDMTRKFEGKENEILFLRQQILSLSQKR